MAQIINKLVFKKQTSAIRYCVRTFSTQQDQQSETNTDSHQNTPPPVFDFEAPKDDYKNFESTNQFIRRYLILLPIAAICLYDMLLVRRNKFSNKREFKLVNLPFEHYILGQFISTKILTKYKNTVYKQETEEVQQVKIIIEDILEKNNLSGIIPFLKVSVIHNDAIIMFMNLDQTMFVSVKALDIAKMNEEQVSLLLCHELAHYLLDHQVSRISKAFFVNNIYFKHMKKFSWKDVYDPARQEFKAKTFIQNYSCFYPQQRVISKFYEKNCDTLAIQLWKTAYPNIDHIKTAEELYEKVDKYIKNQPNVNLQESYHSSYTYKRKDVNLKLLAAQLIQKEVE